MTDVLLVAHHDRVEAAALARTAAQWLHEHGHRAVMTPDDATALHLDDLACEAAPAGAELALSLGGDGTMLRTVKLVTGEQIPIIGINVGLLGYLTELEPPGMIGALERWFAGPAAGEWTIEERMMLDLHVRRADASTPTSTVTVTSTVTSTATTTATSTVTGEPPTPAGCESWTALNEGVVEKQESGHTIRLLVRIDGVVFTSYAADGLIIATPTGSTAYSLSARGPVVSPRHRLMLLTPVAPHMLFDRSLVLLPDEVVEIEVLGGRSATLSVDGQVATALTEGDVIAVRTSNDVAKFVRFGLHHFHQILKTKFGLANR